MFDCHQRVDCHLLILINGNKLYRILPGCYCFTKILHALTLKDPFFFLLTKLSGLIMGPVIPLNNPVESTQKHKTL